MAERMKQTIVISIEEGDALTFRADVLALKYAQALYGVDEAVVDCLSQAGQDIITLLPNVGEFRFIDPHNQIASQAVLFIGVKRLHQFGYQEIREFGRKVLVCLAREAPKTKHVCLTLHGPGYGLDEAESFEAEIAGVLDAITSGNFPEELERITIIEQDLLRAKRLKQFLSRLVPRNRVDINDKGKLVNLGEVPEERLRVAGYASASKPNIFVAMPFSDDMEDQFHYGIQGAVNAAGYLCERADLSVFTGNVIMGQAAYCSRVPDNCGPIDRESERVS